MIKHSNASSTSFPGKQGSATNRADGLRELDRFFAALTAARCRSLKTCNGPEIWWNNGIAGDSLTEDDRISLRKEDQLAYKFNVVTCSRHRAAEPDSDVLDLEYEPKVILE